MIIKIVIVKIAFINYSIIPNRKNMILNFTIYYRCQTIKFDVLMKELIFTMSEKIAL